MKLKLVLKSNLSTNLNFGGTKHPPGLLHTLCERQCKYYTYV